MATNVERYWMQFLASFPSGSERPTRYTDVFYFGTRPEHGSLIADLVVSGSKTATGALQWTYDDEGKPLPQPGDLNIVTDGFGHPICVIETIDTRVVPFNEVDGAYAWEGGEGDRTLHSWREIYWDYIVAECERLGREPTSKAPLVMERFRVVYQEPLAPGDHLLGYVAFTSIDKAS